MKNDSKPIYALLGLILITGFFLRFWQFWNIPFMFDELSAMGRTIYSSFSDLIRFGVVERDSHPAGIQVFLYYWVRLLGDSEQIVKLPFLIMGLVSVWLSFKIGDLWFGKTNGVLTAALVSSLQLFVMYSQIARPYSSGLFFTQLMVLYWSRYFLIKPKIRYLVGFVIFASLAAYNHYFSLLFAATVGMSGLFLVNRKTVFPYIFSGIAILVLYLPHLGIIFAQAEKGSIGGWLGEPGPYFLLNFLFWLFHKSFFSLGIFLIVLLAGSLIVNPSDEKLTFISKKRMLLLLWLLPAPVFGYVYSYLKEPILQNSLLIFTTPYFFMFLFSFTGNLGWKKLSVTVVMLLLVNSLTLIFARNYYENFYKQPFQNLAESAIQLEKKFPDEVFIINDYVPYFTDYYFSKDQKKQIPYFTTRNAGLNIVGFDSLVSTIDQKVVITSGLDDQYFQILKKHFPYWIAYDKGFTFEQYTLSKTKQEGFKVLENKLISTIDFKEKKTGWQFSQANLIFDSVTGKPVYAFKRGITYGLKYSFDFDSIFDTPYYIIDIELDLKPLDDNCEALLVFEVKKGDDQLAWRGFDFKLFNYKKGVDQKFYATIDIQKVLGNLSDLDGCKADIYIWNRNDNNFTIGKIVVSYRPGNPERYSL